MLAEKAIFNARRSNNIQEIFLVYVDLYTTNETLDMLKGKMIAFLKLHPRIFRPTMRMDLNDIGTTNMMTLRVSIDFKGNWPDAVKRWDNRSLFLFAFKDALCALDIKFSLPVQKVELIQP